MEYIFFITISILVLLTVAVVSSILNSQKVRLSLEKSFGKSPNNVDYELDSINTYHFYLTQNVNIPHSIDDITWNDLDMDSVFRRINSCLTSVGEEYLYSILHTPVFEVSSLKQREALIDYLDKNPAVRINLQLLLSKMGKQRFNGLSDLLFDAQSKKLNYTFLYRILAFIPIICIATIPFNLLVGLLALVVSCIINMAVHYMSKRKIESEFSAIGYFSSMLWCSGKICKLNEADFAPHSSNLKSCFAIFKPISSKVSGMMKKSMSEFEVITEYFSIIFLMDLRNYNRAIDMICKYSKEFHDLYRSLGEIDLAICMLSYRKSLAYYSTPQFVEEKMISATELYHPLLSHPVENDAEFDKNCIITGSNASGKSTFIKSLALNGILAQTIYTCTAKSYSAKPSLVMTSMAARDDITQGDSYFITEIKSLKRIIDKTADIYCTCFIDEILKGTNTVERISASASVLKFLSKANCICMVASHDIELTELLSSLYENYHFCETVTDEGIEFDYKLKSGACTTRNAIKLLHFMEFDDGLVADAEEMVCHFLSSKKWRLL